MPRSTSRSYLNPQLQAALDSGQSIDQWLAGRTPGVSYARISADQVIRSKARAGDKDEGEGVENQHRNNTLTGTEYNIAIVRYYEDNNLTAVDPDIERPAFLEMTRHLLHRKTPEGFYINACIAVENKRVYRLPEDYIRFRRAIITEDDGIFIEDSRPYDLHSVGGNIVGLVEAGTAEGEVSDTKKRLLRNVNDRAMRGRPHGGRRRFGWLGGDLATGRRCNEKLCPEESPWLRKMIEESLAHKSRTSIAEILNEAGITGSMGGKWTAKQVGDVVTNPVICGYRKRKGKLVVDPETGEPVRGTWETIATPEEWLQLDNQKNKNVSKYVNGPRGKKYLYSGFARCGRLRKDNGQVCMSPLGGQPYPTKNKPDRKIYVCNSLGCGGIGRDMENVDNYLTELVLTALERKHKKAAPKTSPWEGKGRLEELRQKLNAHESKWLDGGIKDEAFFYRIASQLKERIDALEVDKKEHEDRLANQNAFAGWDRSRWNDMDLKQKRQAISHVIQAVIVLPLPKGRAKHAPFDANLLVIVPKS